jgi:hypothetical protein
VSSENDKKSSSKIVGVVGPELGNLLGCPLGVCDCLAEGRGLLVLTVVSSENEIVVSKLMPSSEGVGLGRRLAESSRSTKSLPVKEISRTKSSKIWFPASSPVNDKSKSKSIPELGP